MTKRIIPLLIISFFITTACNKTELKDSAHMQTIERKDVQLSTKQTACIEYGNALALNYFKAMYKYNKEKDGDGDFLVSPLGLEMFLGLLNSGATGDASEQILTIMGFQPGETAQLNEYLSTLANQLLALDPLSRIRISNVGFINKDRFLLEQSYVEDASHYYDAPVTSEDFTNADELTNRINNWCNEKTEGMIPSIIDYVNPQCYFYMFNALYFNGAWTSRFDTKNTNKEVFNLENGGTTKVMMMKQETQFGYHSAEGFQIACLPYGNEAFRMIILLPDEDNGIEEILSSLDCVSWKEMVSKVSFQMVDVWLPRFETEKCYDDLNKQIESLGLGSIFIPGNLDNLAKDIAAQQIIQKTHIKVTEEGTEAAAVTGNHLFFSTGDGPDPVAVFHANHPFLYFITEYSTGAILFAGKYAGKTS